jgi:hypothetical protein
MIMANFLTSRYQYGNSLPIADYEIVIAVHIDHFELEMKSCLQILQSGNHVLAKMAVLAAIYREWDGSTARNRDRCIIYSRHSSSS